MACGACPKKDKVKRPVMDTKFFKRSLVEATRMKDANLSEKTNKQLLDYHRKCHMLYGGNMKNRPVNKQFINSIVELHNRIVEEMTNRKMKHNTPLRKI